MESGDKIRYFLEDKALNANHDFQVDIRASVNKIGHCLHELDPVFSKFSKSQDVVEISKSLGFKDCRILQSMLIFKQPFIGSPVPPHVDSTFLYTNPPSAVGLWFALEDSSMTNGTLWFAPGSHKSTRALI